MSRYFSDKFRALTPYTPGEQPRDQRYIKLNTNESPFPPSPLAMEKARLELDKLQLYSDPTCASLTTGAAKALGVGEENIIFSNGSDEVLNFAFMAFCDENCPAVFPDITYGFYKVFAKLNGIPYEEIPLKEDFTLDISDYFCKSATIFIANPNAPTGLYLNLRQIEGILRANPDNVVVIDEAYIDFGGESSIPLTKNYDNLLVVQTFSKSRSMAGARLGFGIGSKALRLLKKYYSEHQMVIEFEAPDESTENNPIRLRRRDFYLRNGFQETGWYNFYDETEFEIACSELPFHREEFEEFIDFLNAIIPIHMPRPYRKG